MLVLYTCACSFVNVLELSMPRATVCIYTVCVLYFVSLVLFQ